MNKILVLMFVLLASATSGFAQVTVAVTPFEAEDHSLRRYVDLARGELENVIVNIGNIQVVERSQMDSMVEELSFGSFSGLANPNEIAKFGNMSGAQIVVTGSLLNASTKKSSFKGFGVKTDSEQTTATIRVRAYDIEKGTIIFSNTSDGNSSGFSTSHGGTGQDDGTSAAIQDALQNLAKDKNFKQMLASLDPSKQVEEKVQIKVNPSPDNCDLEVNGLYYGSTPTNIELVSGVNATIKLSRAGYVPWERTISARQGMRISPELEKKSDQ